MLNNLKKQVVCAAKKLYANKLVAGYSGNISALDVDSGLVAITPSSTEYSEMQESDIVIINLNGDVIEGTLPPSSEWKMHTQIYRKNNNVKAVVHTHSQHATALAVLGKPIPLILIEMVPFLGGDIQIAEFALPGSLELGNKVVEKISERNGCLLANHGVVATGDSVEAAYVNAEYIEDAAKIYNLACISGTPKTIPSEFVIQMLEAD